MIFYCALQQWCVTREQHAYDIFMKHSDKNSPIIDAKIPFSSSKFTLATEIHSNYWFCGFSQESLYSKLMATMEYFVLIKTLVFVSHDSLSVPHIFFSLTRHFTLCLKICKIWLLSSSTFTFLDYILILNN